MDKVKEYNPKKHKVDINNGWIVTFKIDGVQVVVADGVAQSRAGKPLYNIPRLPDGTYECFLGTWESSVSACRTITGSEISADCFYRIDPGHVDKRLHMGMLPYDGSVEAAFQFAKRGGYEGLVLHGPDGQMLKVKDKQTYDVPVIGIQAGKGKHEGRMGALITPRGKVGTGFKDADREFWVYEYMNGGLTGHVIEVECMELTAEGRFRHPRFVRVRPDKTVEMCD